MEPKFDNEQQESELQQMASRKVVKLKSFYKQLFFYAVGLTIFLLKEYIGFVLAEKSFSY